MNEEQRQQLIDFAPNFVGLLAEAGFSHEQATEALHSSFACLFAAIWKIPTSVTLSEEDKEFLLSVQVMALRLFYGQVVA